MWCPFLYLKALWKANLMREGKNIFERNSENPKCTRRPPKSWSQPGGLFSWQLFFLYYYYYCFSLFAKQLRRLGLQTELAIEICFLFWDIGRQALKFYFQTWNCFAVESKIIKEKKKKWTKYQKSQALFRKQGIGEQLWQVWALQPPPPPPKKKLSATCSWDRLSRRSERHSLRNGQCYTVFFFRKPMQLSNFDGIVLPPEVTEFFTQL